MYYSADWQLLEEHIGEDASPTGPTKYRVAQEFWGIRHIDDPVMRRVRIPTTTSQQTQLPTGRWTWTGGTTDAEFYHITDAQFSTRAMIRAVKYGEVVERVRYSAYGVATHRYGADMNDDGVLNSVDYDHVKENPSSIADPNYDPQADLNRDGVVDTNDLAIEADWTGRISVLSGGISDSSLNHPLGPGPDNRFGYAGYRHEPINQRYNVRYRWYEPGHGRWMSRDPLKYIDGSNMYGYCSGDPINWTDPFGLEPGWWIINAPQRVAHNIGQLFTNSKNGDVSDQVARLNDEYQSRIASDPTRGPIARSDMGANMTAGRGAALEGSPALYEFKNVALPVTKAATEELMGMYATAGFGATPTGASSEVLAAANKAAKSVADDAARMAAHAAGKAWQRCGFRKEIGGDVWSKAIDKRGVEIEQALGKNTPDPYPVIDRLENGVATSIKSMDLSAKTYQKASALESKVKGYIDDVSGFEGSRLGTYVIDSTNMKSKSLELVVPHAAPSAAQQGAIDRAIEYGRSLNIEVKIIRTPE